jgi:hypothetical protein
MLTGKKLALLSHIASKDEYPSLEALAKSAGMSLPLVSYYVRGMKENEGLAQMGLIDVTESGGRLKVAASPLGKLLLKGYNAPKPEDSKKHLTLK